MVTTNSRGQCAVDVIEDNETVHVASVTCVCVGKVASIVDQVFGKVKPLYSLNRAIAYSIFRPTSRAKRLSCRDSVHGLDL